MSEKIFVTQEGLKKLQEELKYLKEVKRVEIAEKLKEAISFGDLSENSEYEDARNEQAAIEKRILDLEKQLKNIEIIEEDKSQKNKVAMGNIIEIQNLSNGEIGEYKIVGTTEADILANPPKISNESIVGKSLLGAKKGDIIDVKAENGNVKYKILSIQK